MGDHPELKKIICILLSGGEISHSQKKSLERIGDEWVKDALLLRIPLSYSPCTNSECEELGEIRFHENNTYYLDCSVCSTIQKISEEERYGWKANIGLLIGTVLKDAINFPQLEQWQGLESTWKLGTRQGVTILFSNKGQTYNDSHITCTVTLEKEGVNSLYLFDIVHIDNSTLTIDTNTLDLNLAKIKGQVLGDTAMTISYGLWRLTYTTEAKETISDIFYGDTEIYSMHTNNKKVRPLS